MSDVSMLEGWRPIVGGTLMVSGALLALIGSLGVLRMPDFFTRLHPAGKTDTIAQGMVMLGLAFISPDWVTAAKVLMMSAILFVTAPTSTYAIARAAFLDGIRPQGVPEKDLNHG